MTKITELPEISVLADDDFVTAVDVSDMSESPTGKNVKIQKQNLLGGSGAVSKFEIARITDPGTGEFDFTAIPSDYENLYIEGWIRSSAVGQSDGTRVYLNGNTTDANYWLQAIEGADGTPNVGEVAAPSSGSITATDGPAGWISQFSAKFINYRGATYRHTFLTNTISPIIAGNMITGWRGIQVTADIGAITQIQVQSDGHPTDTLVGTLILYGEKTI